MPEHHDVKTFYDGTYYPGDHGHHRAPWHMRKIASRLQISPGDSALDIACGTGAWLQELQGHGAAVSGIDISERAIASAKVRLPNADIRQGVAEDLPFDDGKFDLITCMGSLEHFLDQPGALHEMRRVAKSSAHYLILVPNSGFLTRRLGLYGGTQQASIKETVRSIDEWSDMFASAGLCVKSKWKDLHTLDIRWIIQGSPLRWPVRMAQAAILPFWPLRWQYQVYFWCVASSLSPKN